MEPAKEKVTNLDFLVNFTAGDRTRLIKYVNMFLNSAPAEVERIKNGLSGNDYEMIRAAAHSLRPQMTYMGIKSGETLLKQMETIAQEKTNTGDMPALVARFTEIFGMACEELKANLNQTT
jgi:HPt (histidine-containing phosphotransfer) domain-containing protein